MSRIFSEETNGGGREGGRHSSRHCSAAALPRPSFPLPPIPRSLSPPAISSVPRRRRRRLAAAPAASPPLASFLFARKVLGKFHSQPGSFAHETAHYVYISAQFLCFLRVCEPPHIYPAHRLMMTSCYKTSSTVEPHSVDCFVVRHPTHTIIRPD